MISERRSTFIVLLILLAITIAMFSKVLFTHDIIRAPDIINEYFWSAKDLPNTPWLDFFRINPGDADWSPYMNSGESRLGGLQSMRFMALRGIIYKLFPLPTSIAWFIVLHIFFGSVGCYCFARTSGCGRIPALFAGLIFAVATENASLVNAGHVLKLATIAFAPWAFYFLERGYRTQRVVWFAATGVVLAFQFFNTHWQIAFYTCIALGIYGVVSSCMLLVDNSGPAGNKRPARLLLLNIIVLLFFIGSVSISLVPLKSWSTETNRGAASGANQGKGGLDREEAMMWSMPPEELVSLVVPGFFGYSRQEAGPNPANIPAYYWGRMVFTQTLTYMGVLPWLLAILAFVWRRDRVTWAATGLILFGFLFSMGKYTPFYNVLFDHLPGIDRFRVPKMMMFVPVWSLAIMAARGLELLLEGEIIGRSGYKRFLASVAGFTGLLVLAQVAFRVVPGFWIQLFMPWIGEPTRYQQGPDLLWQRWNNMNTELLIATLIVAACLVLFGLPRLKNSCRRWVGFALIGIFLLDVGRVNAKFFFTVPQPHMNRGGKTPTMEFLVSHIDTARVLPIDGSDPMQYAVNKIPVVFTSNAVQQRRWQELLDIMLPFSPLADMLNVKYLVINNDEYEQQKQFLVNRYVPVFRDPVGGQIVLENRMVMPKAWLATNTVVITDRQQRLLGLQNSMFNPRQIAIVENTLPTGMVSGAGNAQNLGNATVESYADTNIVVKADTPVFAVLVLGEKYFEGWKAYVDGSAVTIQPVNHVLRGVYLAPGQHRVEFRFDPLPYKVGKSLTLGTFAIFLLMLGYSMRKRRSAD